MTTYVTGRDIGQTERAMQQLLESILAGTPLASTEHWVALTVIANAPVAPDTAGLSRALRSSLSDTASVADDLAPLASSSIVTAGCPARQVECSSARSSAACRS